MSSSFLRANSQRGVAELLLLVENEGVVSRRIDNDATANQWSIYHTIQLFNPISQKHRIVIFTSDRDLKLPILSAQSDVKPVQQRNTHQRQHKKNQLILCPLLVTIAIHILLELIILPLIVA